MAKNGILKNTLIFLVCTYTSENFVQSQKYFAVINVHVSMTFRNSAQQVTFNT